MKQKRMTLLAIGSGVLCAACVAVFLMSVQSQADSARNEALARYGGEQVEICVATRDIAAGERVDVSAIETKLWVADLLPEGAISTGDEVIGKTVASPILKGEVVSAKRFESDRNPLDIPAGKEAVSVPAKAVQAVGGAVQAGMSVDVYSSGSSTTTVIAKSVLVLDSSVGGTGSLVSSDAGWVTLAVDSEKVQEIIAASNKSSLYFVIPGEEPEQAAAEEDGAKKEDGAEGGKSAADKDASSSGSESKKEDAGKEDAGKKDSAEKKAGDS